MPKYYVNQRSQSNGDHEVHKSDCTCLPNPEHRTYLGSFDNCHQAVAAAKKIFTKSNGCYYCSRNCHTS